MKNNFKNLTLLCVAGALFAACSNELEPSTTPGAVKVTAVATTDSDNDTRLAFEEDNEANKLRVTWEESGESFYVYVGEETQTPAIFTQTGTNVDGNKTATFSGTISAHPGDVIYAIYSKYGGYRDDTNVKSLQIYCTNYQSSSEYDPKASLMYAKAVYTDEKTPLEFTFRPLTAALKAVVKFPEGVTGMATNVFLITDDDYILNQQSMDFTGDKPKRAEYGSRGGGDRISFTNESFTIAEDGTITVYALLLPDEVTNLQLIATVGDKKYRATLMTEKTLEAGKWYYPKSGAKIANEVNDLILDATTHTVHIVNPGDLALYSADEATNLLVPIIDSETGLLKVTGTPSDNDLSIIGNVATALQKEGNANELKVLDLSECMITKIPAYGFSGLSSLEEVKLPPSVTSIEENTFSGCSRLASINLDNIVYIGHDAFYGCKRLANIDLSACITIGSSAFYDCDKLVEIDLTKCKTIWDNAFSSCRNLTTVDLPEATAIGHRAFSFCNSISNLNAPLLETVSNEMFYYAGMGGVVNIPKCNSIGSGVFWKISNEFTLKLTCAGEIEVPLSAFYDRRKLYSEMINLVLNPDKESEVINGNEWKGLTFKSITYEEPKDDI